MNGEFEQFRTIAAKASRGDKDAEDFLMLVVEALHLWDDIVDKDKVLSDAHVGHVFRELLLYLPRNPFYQRHLDALGAVLAVAIENWKLATARERNALGTKITLTVAFIIRSSYVDLAVLVAMLCGPVEHVEEIAREIRALAHAEGLEGYVKALDAERSAREGD